MAALALTTLRVALAPALLWITRDGRAGAWYVVCCLVALVSDIVDDVIARRAGVEGRVCFGHARTCKGRSCSIARRGVVS